MRTDRQTDRQTLKVIVAFSNFAKAPKNQKAYIRNVSGHTDIFY